MTNDTPTTEHSSAVPAVKESLTAQLAPTPETDAAEHGPDSTPWSPWVYSDVARRLERERDQARRDRDEASSEIQRICNARNRQLHDIDRNHIKQLAAAQAENERLRKIISGLLDNMQYNDIQINGPEDQLDIAIVAAHKALAAQDDQPKERLHALLADMDDEQQRLEAGR